jgi:hypothetical protein
MQAKGNYRPGIKAKSPVLFEAPVNTGYDKVGFSKRFAVSASQYLLEKYPLWHMIQFL